MNFIEAILALLFENIFLVVLLIGGIISFLKRLNPEPEERPKVPMQTNPEYKDFVDTYNDEITEITGLEYEGQSYKQSANNGPKREKPKIQPVNKTTRNEIKDAQIGIKHVSRQKIINGVIWSEILGPPKSRQKNGKLGR